MSTNAIALSRSLVAAGLESGAADAVAEAIVTHSDERLATKSDIARLDGALKSDITRLEGALKSNIVRLDGEIKSLAMLVKVNLGLTIGLYIGIAALFIEKPLDAG